MKLDISEGQLRKLRKLTTTVETVSTLGPKSYVRNTLGSLVTPSIHSNLLANCPWMTLRGNPEHQLHNFLGHKWREQESTDVLVLGNSMVHDLFSPCEELGLRS